MYVMGVPRARNNQRRRIKPETRNQQGVRRRRGRHSPASCYWFRKGLGYLSRTLAGEDARILYIVLVSAVRRPGLREGIGEAENSTDRRRPGLPL